MHKNATKCNETLSKWCKNKYGTSKIIDTFETYQMAMLYELLFWTFYFSGVCGANPNITLQPCHLHILSLILPPVYACPKLRLSSPTYIIQENIQEIYIIRNLDFKFQYGINFLYNLYFIH
jgi:hypothetical protein